MHIVTATIQAKTKLRRETVPSKKTEILGSGFVGKDGQVHNFYGIDGEIIDLEIFDKINFDLDIPHEKKNWITLKIMKLLYAADMAHIDLIDKEQETNEAIDFSDKVFEIETFLRKNKEDSQLMKKIYRRLVGLVDGITDNSVFRKLIELAKAQPLKFMERGKLIVEAEEFEMLALIDVCIERRILLRDEKLIKLSNGKIYASDEKKAAFLLLEDVEQRVYLQRAVSGETNTGSSVYEPVIEDSEYVALSKQLLSDVDQTEKEEDSNLLTEAELSEGITRLVKEELIIKEGVGIQTNYTLPDHPTTKFTKKQLIAFFQKNPVQYRMLNKMAFA